MNRYIEHRRKYPPMAIPPGLETWTDHHGKTWPTPTIKQRPKFARIAAHAALRAFVFVRDGFACQECGVVAEEQPVGYDGRSTVSIAKNDCCLVVDHIVSRRNGGIHHPSNLRAACDHCNSAKAGAVDAKHPNAILGRADLRRRRGY